MPTLTLPKNLTQDDYVAIEGAVMETVRGRWFLMEFARRSRVAELAQIRDSIARLERMIGQASASQPAAPPALRVVKPAPEAPAPSPLHQALEALSRFDNLAVEEKVALFG